MAIGMVWVFPGILPANMKVAPNSPNARARLKILPDIRALEAKGIEIKKKMAHSSAPSDSCCFFNFLIYTLKS